MGDLLLIQVSRRLSGLLRAVDTIARLGEDEFVILLDEISGIGEAITIAGFAAAKSISSGYIRDWLNYPSRGVGF
jgi:GGDEF domain-containing protein